MSSRNGSLNLVFDGTCIYKLWAEVESQDLTAIIAGYADRSHTVGKPVADGHSVNSPHGRRRVYRASLEALGGNSVDNDIVYPKDVAVKWARDQDTVNELRYEAELYTTNLRPLQGTVVPRFYGFFSAKVDGSEVGCIILEWCENNFLGTEDEINRQRMIAVCKLHQAGVVHGNLMDGHHMLVLPGGTVRIVDFTTAFLQQCEGEIPSLLSEGQEKIAKRACEELYDMERTYGAKTGEYYSKYVRIK